MFMSFTKLRSPFNELSSLPLRLVTFFPSTTAQQQQHTHTLWRDVEGFDWIYRKFLSRQSEENFSNKSYNVINKSSNDSDIESSKNIWGAKLEGVSGASRNKEVERRETRKSSFEMRWKSYVSVSWGWNFQKFQHVGDFH